jgi:hypothetical protein
MANPAGVRLVEACESMCDQLRTALGLTSFRIQLERRTTPLVVSLRPFEATAAYDPRHDRALLGTAAVLEIPVRDGPRVIGNVLIEDARRPGYPEDARHEGERIAALFAPELSGLLRETSL